MAAPDMVQFPLEKTRIIGYGKNLAHRFVLVGRVIVERLDDS